MRRRARELGRGVAGKRKQEDNLDCPVGCGQRVEGIGERQGARAGLWGGAGRGEQS
jgi:hypothetical protein